jgi:phenylacetate-CoA ligase
VLSLQHQFETVERLSPTAILDLQRRQLGVLLTHARDTVPFYAERLKAAEPSGPEGPTMAAWRKLPILWRSELQDAGETMWSRALPKEHLPLDEVSSSGSTGRAVTVKTTGVTGLLFTTLNLRSHLWAGRSFSATICGIRALDAKRMGMAEANTPLQWAPGYRSGPMYLYDITRPVSGQLDWLAAKAPDYLLTNPTNLMALIELARERGLRLPTLRHVATMGETLSPGVRKACEEDWGIPVQDIYSAVEIGIIALQCPEHKHSHVMADNVLVEVLHEDGRACRPGEVGAVVVTALHNFAQPLIRYAVGDYAEVGPSCPCGRGLPVLTRILGRERNMLVLPNGDRLWPNMPSSKWAHLAPLKQIQLIQHSVEEIEARIVSARALTADEERNLAKAFGDLFRRHFRFRFTYLDDIPRSKGGKFEGFISLVSRT